MKQRQETNNHASSKHSGPARLMTMASAFYGSAVLFAASDAGVFACLAEAGTLDVKGIVDRCGLDLRAGRLLLDGCVALGLLKKDGALYRNASDVSAFLVPGKAGDLSGAIRYNRDVYAAWGRLPELARTGTPVEQPEIHLGEDRDRTRTFVLSMHGRALGIGRAVVPQLNVSACHRILDVGGGPGTYSVLLAKHNPDVERCTVLDLPAIVEVADELIAEAGVSDRVHTLPGSYHDTDFPPGQDAVLFFGVLHQEAPEDIARLLQRAFDALNPGGHVYVMDMMTDSSRAAPAFSALFAIGMALTTVNGWVFSDEDLRFWLASSGYAEIEVGPLAAPMPHWLAIAKKPML